MKKLLSLVLAVVLLCSVSLACAATVTPDNTEYGNLEGTVVNATVGDYNEYTKTLTVTLYRDDSFEIGKVEKLAVGDTILAGGRVMKVKEKKEEEDGSILVTDEDGNELEFMQVGDDHMILQLTEDDRRIMSAYAVMQLPVAEGIVYEDNSDPDAAEPAVTKGLAEILKIKAEKEKNSIGFDYYATIIELNENLEIVRIHQDFDVAQ